MTRPTITLSLGVSELTIEDPRVEAGLENGRAVQFTARTDDSPEASIFVVTPRHGNEPVTAIEVLLTHVEYMDDEVFESDLNHAVTAMMARRVSRLGRVEYVDA